MHRRTLSTPANMKGIGLFSGRDTTLTIHPAEPGTGLLFRRADLGIDIPAHIDRLDTRPVHPAFAGLSPRNTTLALDPRDPDSPRVMTTEHALGALAGLGITDAILELDADELPIDDGSAIAFTRAIRKPGNCELGGPIQPITPSAPIRVGSDTSWIELTPAESPSFRYEIDYGPSAPFPAHTAECDSPESFEQQIAPARTFSLEAEVTPLRALGLFARFTPADLLVIGGEGPIDNDWRNPHEPARHKVLDLIGDLALAGAPVCARIVAHRSGHALNHELARRLSELR